MSEPMHVGTGVVLDDFRTPDWLARIADLRRQEREGRIVDRVDEMFQAILAGKAQPIELRWFADALDALGAPEAA